MSTSLAELYLHSHGGSTEDYLENLKNGQRLGQAFFNALSDHDKQRLRGTLNDPFYVVHGPVLERVITYLLDTE